MVPTDEMADGLSHIGFERLRVVGRGINDATFSPSRRSGALRARWRARDDDLVAICISRFAPEKDFPLVIDAYKAMRAANPGTQLVLVGEGPMESELRRANIGHVVAGRLEDEDLSAHYASGDVFLFASLTETFGNVTLEAMASGLAVVAYRTAAARQHIKHEHSGLLAAPGDRADFIALAARLAGEPVLVPELGHRARAAIQPVSWERITRDFESVLAEFGTPTPSAA